MSPPDPPGEDPNDDAVAATPFAVQLARALKVDLMTIRPATGSGPVTALDVQEAVRTLAKAARTLEPAETIALAEPRSRRTGDASPLLTVSASAPAGLLEATVDRHTSAEILDLLLYAVAATLRSHVRLNAHLEDGQLLLFEEVNLGFSVPFDDCLVFPVLRGAGKSGLVELARERSRLAQAVNSAELQPWELESGTFTVSDLGQLGIDTFTPTPVTPQVAALGVGRLAQRPAVVAGSVTSRAELPINLAYDARAVEDVAAARFLHDLIALLDDASWPGTGVETT